MKQGLMALLVAMCVSTVAYAEAKYTTGIEKDGETILHLSYHPTPYAEGKTFEAMKSGELEDRYVDNFNSGGRFGKVADMKVAVDLHIGEIHVPKGEYKAGLNVDYDGNFSFVVWMGEGDEAKAHATPIKLEKHEAANIPNLCLFLTPGGDEVSHLMMCYGNYFAAIGVSTGGSPAPGSDSAK